MMTEIVKSVRRCTKRKKEKYRKAEEEVPGRNKKQSYHQQKVYNYKKLN